MIALFVLKLLAGITLMWWLMPRAEVTDGFFKIQMRLVLGLAVLGSLFLWRDVTSDSTDMVPAAVDVTDDLNPRTAAESKLSIIRRWQLGLQTGVAVLAYCGSVFWALGRRFPGTLCIHAMVVASCGALGLHSVLGRVSGIWLQLLSDFSSSAVCGSVLTGMLLGHWYLTTPTMSTKPMWWFNTTIVVSVALRLTGSLIAVMTEGIQLPGITHWIWLAVRWLGTIVVPFIVAVLVWRILRYRNTQSATGVLFAGLILVLMGEMSGAILEQDLNIPY